MTNEVAPPSGWSVESITDRSGRWIHSDHALTVKITPVYSRGRSAATPPSYFRVERKQDWFSTGILGDQEKGEKVETFDEAVERAEEYMEEFTTEPPDSTLSTQTRSRRRRTQTSLSTEPVSTGSDGLDSVLNGGLPRGRAILIAGTPGAGKSTLAMQFLQAGLDDGDRCLYISTEQSREEVHGSFTDFDFDLDDENLSISTIHAVSTESGETQVGTLGNQQDHEVDDDAESFTREGVLNYLRNGVDADRVVLDSVSGLQPLAQSNDEYRRAVLDVIRLFSDEFDATTMLTSEYYGGSAGGGDGVEQIARDNAVQYNAHGVIRIWRQRVRGQYRRMADVMKMRGVNHDTRAFETRITSSGLRVLSGSRSYTPAEEIADRLTTGNDQLDRRFGGGLLRDGGLLYEHDAGASVLPFLLAIGNSLIDEMLSLVILPGTEMRPSRFNLLFEQMGTDIETLIERDQLFIVDVYGVWDRSRFDSENVIRSDESEANLESIYESIAGRARGRGTCYINDVPALVSRTDDHRAQEFRYWLEATLVDSNDLLIDISNPELIGSDTESFYNDISQQAITHWVSEAGIQYLKTNKGPGAQVGTVDALEFSSTSPYVDLF